MASLLIIRASDAVQRAKALAQTAVEADQKGHVNQAILRFGNPLNKLITHSAIRMTASRSKI